LRSEEQLRPIDIAARLGDIVDKLDALVDLNQSRGQQIITLECTEDGAMVYPGPDELGGTPVPATSLGITDNLQDLRRLLTAAYVLPKDTEFADLEHDFGIGTGFDDHNGRRPPHLTVTIDHSLRLTPTHYDWRHLAVVLLTVGLGLVLLPPWTMASVISGCLVVVATMIAFSYPLRGEGRAQLSAARGMIRPLWMFGATGLLCGGLAPVLFPASTPAEPVVTTILTASGLLLVAPWACLLELNITTRLLFRRS
jgi:hypothetical protein